MSITRIVSFVFLFLLVSFIASGQQLDNDFQDFDKDSRLENLSAPIRCFFIAASKNDSKALAACFSDDVSVNIAGMLFNGPEEVVSFAERDIWGGKYKVEEAFKQGNKEIVYCLFWPQGWSSPEPAIEYQFQIENGKILKWDGKYR